MRNKIVNQAKSWLGRKESNGTHKAIIDTYNQIRPLPRGYAVKYTDEWCATFASAVAYVCGCLDVVPAECSCSRMIEGFKAKGSWMENDNYVPSPGDFIFYDWDDSGKGENKGNPEHVGIVEKVANGVITVIEGNIRESVGRRELKINGRYIRGFGVPKYKGQTASPTTNMVSINLPVLQRGSKGNEVKTLQRLLLALKKYDLGGYGADGSFGPATEKAVIQFQKDRELVADGIVGTDTWTALLR